MAKFFILVSKDLYVDSDVNPLWDYEAHFPVEQPEGLSLQLEVLTIVIYLSNFLTVKSQVFDFDAGSEDDFLGQFSLEISSVVENGPFEVTCSLLAIS